MGLIEFFIKHGPGSVGATAKAITKNYLQFRKQVPSLSHAELLRLVVRDRILTYERTKVICPFDLDIVDASEGDLKKLIYLVVMFETPDGRDISISQTQMVIKVIKEVVDKQLQNNSPN